MKDPTLVHTLARQYGATTVVVDSLKDVVAKLTDDESGTNERLRKAATIIAAEMAVENVVIRPYLRPRRHSHDEAPATP